MNPRKSKKHPETTGIADLRLDKFADVKRALDAHLLKTDPVYQRMSRESIARNARRTTNTFRPIE